MYCRQSLLGEVVINEKEVFVINDILKYLDFFEKERIFEFFKVKVEIGINSFMEEFVKDYGFENLVFFFFIIVKEIYIILKKDFVFLDNEFLDMQNNVIYVNIGFFLRNYC